MSGDPQNRHGDRKKTRGKKSGKPRNRIKGLRKETFTMDENGGLVWHGSMTNRQNDNAIHARLAKVKAEITILEPIKVIKKNSDLQDWDPNAHHQDLYAR